MTYDGDHFIDTEDLPIGIAIHCVAAINETHAVISGGENSDAPVLNRAWIFNRITEEFTPTANMVISSRDAHI